MKDSMSNSEDLFASCFQIKPLMKEKCFENVHRKFKPDRRLNAEKK